LPSRESYVGAARETTMSNAAEIEAVLFKRIGDRYLFQEPNPWIVGRKRGYLVNDVQKQQLLAIVMPGRPLKRLLAITLGILLWTIAVSMMVSAASPHADPTVSDAVAMFVLIVVPIAFALVVASQRNLRRMRPILAGAAPTNERITHGELRQAMTKAISLRQSLLRGGLWAVTCGFQLFILVIRNARHPLLSDVQSYLNLFTATVSAGLVVYYLVIAIRKLRQTEMAA
jgi:hypothetical protein